MTIPIKWQRIRIMPTDGIPPYQDFNMFFTAMINEYKYRLTNDPENTSFNILAFYHKSGLTQIIELFPRDDQLFMLESCIRLWILNYTPDYYVRMHACTIRSNKKEVIIFDGSSKEGHIVTKTFEIIRKHDSNSILDFKESKSPNFDSEEIDPFA